MRRSSRDRRFTAEVLLFFLVLSGPCVLVFLASSGRIAARLGNPSSTWARLVAGLPCALFLFAVSGLLVYLLKRDWQRFLGRDGHCLECGYDLRGSEASVCPECGADRTIG